MKTEDRKAAIAAYKELKPVAGIYAVRCSSTGQVWVGQSRNLDTIQNRIWFTLRLGNSPHRTLQTAWNEEGGEAFSFEQLEHLEDDESSYTRAATLKQRLEHWRAESNALVI